MERHERTWAFVHDHRFVEADDGLVYTSGTLNAQVWDRYLSNGATRLVVIARRAGLNTSSKIKIAQRIDVDFHLLGTAWTPKTVVFGRRKQRKFIEKALHECGVDAVIARLPSELGFIAVSIAVAWGLPYAVEVTGCPFDGLWNYGSLSAKAYAPWWALKTRKSVKDAPFALYVTNEFLQKRYPNRRGHVTSCSNVEIPEPEKHVIQSRLSNIERGSSRLVLGLIGTLSGRFKGIQTVLKALGRVRNEMPPVEFRVLGGGEIRGWRQQAEKWGVRDIVYFDGTLPSGQPVLEWLDNIDLYLQPSLKEGLPRAVIEAMSRGCPVIGSRCGGIPELLDGSCLVPPGDPIELGRLLVQRATDKDWQLEQASRNWEKAKRFSSVNMQRCRAAFWSQFARYTRFPRADN